MNNVKPVVFVRDGDVATRRTIESWLAAAGMDARQYASVTEFLTSRDPGTPGCVVLGNTAAAGGEAELNEMSAVRRADMPVVQVIKPGDVAHAVCALREGAAEVLEKPLRQQQVVDCVRAVLRRAQQLRPRNAADSEVAIRISRLSKREHEVLWYIVAGRNSEEIARKLGFSRRTADFHRANILRKMQAESVAELIDVVVTYRNEKMWGSTSPHATTHPRKAQHPRNLRQQQLAGA